MDYLTLWYGILFVGAVVTFVWYRQSQQMNIGRVGPKPSIFGNTSKGEFYSRSAEMVEEGYQKYSIFGLCFSLWTTNMDRVLIPPSLMDEFNRIPRSWVKLTATLRHVGKYTGMDVADEGTLGYDVCIGPLTQNIVRLCQPIFDEIRYSLGQKLQSKNASIGNGTYTLNMYSTILELVTTSTARMFVGPDLCRDPQWLATASGYTVSVGTVTKDLQQHYQFLHPIIAPMLKSYKELQKRHAEAAAILLPVFAQRRILQSAEHQDMIQWLVEASAKDVVQDTDKLIKRMMFLNMAAIHTTTHSVVNVVLDLCDRPEYIEPIRQEMIEAIQQHGSVKASTLADLKLLDSFLKESQRLNPMDLMVFNRYVDHPISLSSGLKIPQGTFISLPLYSLCRDPERYPDPLSFNGNRFYDLRQKSDEARFQFAASDRDGPGWGFGKYACPGRFWAAAQIKLVLINILLRFDVSYPEGQKNRPEDIILGERRTPSRTQEMVLRDRATNGVLDRV